MKDVHATKDQRGIPLPSVGIQGLTYPIRVKDKLGDIRHTTGKFTLSVGCPANQRGIHMSRLVGGVNTTLTHSALDMFDLSRAVNKMCETQQSNVSVEFPYFTPVTTPVTNSVSLLHVKVVEEVTSDAFHGEEYTLVVSVPVMTLCPCSKEISDYGAHNQRSYVNLQVSYVDHFDKPHFEDIITWALEAGSAPIYPLLKRPDERHVTMQAHDNPKFVEDVVRDLALKVQGDARIHSFNIKVISDESIHNHQAFAEFDYLRGDWE